MTADQAIQQAAAILARSRRLIVLTGAGISKESGIPTFRDALDGLWERYSPEDLATPQAFRRNPKLVWDWYEHRRAMVRRAVPNPGHRALADLEDLLPQVVIVTQNVDDLHQRAGSTDVIPLHGAIMRSKCFNACRGEPTLIEIGSLPGFDPVHGPPTCPHCGGWVRPDVVWFGENLPSAALSRAVQLAEAADVMLVVGTSGVVKPAARLPFIARRSGAVIVEANPFRSQITALAEVRLEAPSGESLPQMVQVVQTLVAPGAG